MFRDEKREQNRTVPLQLRREKKGHSKSDEKRGKGEELSGLLDAQDALEETEVVDVQRGGGNDPIHRRI